MEIPVTLAELRSEMGSGVEAARREEKLRRTEWIKEWRKLMFFYVERKKNGDTNEAR